MKKIQTTIKHTYKPMPDFSRPFSWSQMSSYEYDPEQWWEKYCLHGRCTKEICVRAGSFNPLCPIVVSSPEMEFGKEIGKKIETDNSFMPYIPRQSKMEFEFKVKFGRVVLIGFGDSFDDVNFKALEEYKTGKKPWTQKRVDEHGQITMYVFMNFLQRKIRPEDVSIRLSWMPTWKDEHGVVRFLDPIEKRVKFFSTKRTMIDVLKFGNRINDTIDRMIEYAKIHSAVSPDLA